MKFVRCPPLCVLVLAAISIACERKAPGPDECVRFASRLFGVQNSALLRYPRAKQEFDTIVTLCLTTPFDRKVTQCTDENGTPLECLRLYGPKSLSDRLADERAPRVTPYETW